MTIKIQPDQEPPSPIREMRQGLGMSQSDLAVALGCSQGYLSEIEAGRRPVTCLMDRLRALHMNAEEISRQQLELVKWKRRHLIQKVREARGVG